MTQNVQMASAIKSILSTMDRDSDWWSSALFWAVFFAAFAALLVVITTFGVNRSVKREKEVAVRDKAAADAGLAKYKIQAASDIAKASEAGLAAGLAAAEAKLRSAEARADAAQANTHASTANAKAASANARAAEANNRAEQSRKDAAEANARAAEANEKAGVLEREAAEARLEQERIKATLAWRLLSPQQTSTLLQGLTAEVVPISGGVMKSAQSS